MTIQEILKTPIAHRGLHSKNEGVPENSLAAFRAAIDAGVGIECDVRILADETVVVFHDSYLKRMTGEKGKIGTINLKRLKNLYLHETQEVIPLFSEVLALIDGQVPLVIELKTHSKKSLIQARIVTSMLKEYSGPMIVSSFSSRAVRHFSHEGFVTGQTFRQKTLLARMTSVAKWIVRGRHGDVLALPLAYRGTILGWIVRSLSDAPALYWTAKNADEKDLAMKEGGVIFEG